MSSHRSLNRRRLLAGAAAAGSLMAAPALVRAQSAPLKVGVLLPRSGAQASIGQLRPLYADYLASLAANGHAEHRRKPYAYGRFADEPRSTATAVAAVAATVLVLVATPWYRRRSEQRWPR